jgi:hypothetical protein
MKTIRILTLVGVLASTTGRAADESSTNAPAVTVVAPAVADAVGLAPAETSAPNAPVLLPNGEPGLRLNFRGVPLDLVLNYLSEAAGFIIVLDAKLTGKIDAWSNQP